MTETEILKEKEARNNILYSKLVKVWKIELLIEQMKDWEL